MEEDILGNTRGEMDLVVEVVKEDLAMVRTGRAKPALVEQVQVEVYNTKMPLLELATISAPDPTLLMIQAWDETIIEDIARAISKSDLNLNPQVDKTVIRIQIPPLTEERRNDMVKLVNQKLESGKVMLRQVRQETKKQVEGLKGQPGVSEDDVHRLLSELEMLTDEFMERVTQLGKTKEDEVLTV